MTDAGILSLTVSELAPKIRSREISPVEVVEAALQRADRFQPVLNSFITILHDKAMEQARQLEGELGRGQYRGPLHGIPVGLKDNLSTAGIRTTLGSKVLVDNVPLEDAHVVARCKEAGAIILGKENMDEFMGGATSNNPHYGPVHNPWELDHIPGGSSGGSGANVSAGVTFASLGTDFAGSVRLPGHFCGIVGLKQTFGRVSQRGSLVTSFNGDHVGPLTRSVSDSALVLQAIAGHDPLDPSTVPVPVPDYSEGLDRNLRGLKMGIPANHYFEHSEIDPEVEVSVRAAINALEEMGVEPVGVSLPSLEYAGALFIPGWVDSLVIHEDMIKHHRDKYGTFVLHLNLAGQFILGRDYSKAMRVQRLVKEDHARVFQQVDFLVTPTAPMPAFPIDATTYLAKGSKQLLDGPNLRLVAKYTHPSNATGLPAITVPCGLTKAGLPMGLQLIGRPFEEALLLRVAANYEAVSPSKGRRPGIVSDQPAPIR